MKNHIFLLGCPAVGKYTIGKKISQKLNYLLFDNTKVVDVASLIFEYGSSNYRKYRDSLRMDFYKRLLSYNKTTNKYSGLISTNVLRSPYNWKYFNNIEYLFDKNKWRTIHIILTASNEVLFTRVEKKSRKLKNCINDEHALKLWISKNKEHSQCYENKDNLSTIDTSRLNIKRTVKIIMDLLYDKFGISPSKIC